MQKIESFLLLTITLILFALISGCTVNRISLLTSEQANAPIQPNGVKVYTSFKEINAPWQLEGMISAYTLPIAANSVDKREALIKNTVAALGMNAIIGLQPRVGENLKRTPRSIGLLATTNANAQPRNALPKFIICMPPANFKIEKTPEASELDQYLLEFVQFSFSYLKGYYVYRCDLPAVNNSSILQGSIDQNLLNKPIGIAPDYALLSEISGYDEQGNVAVHRSFTLKLGLTLYDLKEKKPVWSKATVGISHRSVLGHILTVGATTTEQSDELQTVRSAILQAMDSLPTVQGFRSGASSPVDRK